MSNLFETAIREKWRFNVGSGRMSAEDLYDLPLKGKPVCLNNLAKSLNKKLKEAGDEDFVDEVSAEDKTLRQQLDLVKYIINYKKSKAEAAEKAVATRQRNQMIKQIIAEKEVEGLKNAGIDELKAMISGGSSK